MIEVVIRIEKVNPARFFGTSNENFKVLKSFFPSLKLTSRGDEITVKGPTEEINKFKLDLDTILDHMLKYPSMVESDLEDILKARGEAVDVEDKLVVPESNLPPADLNEVLVYGNKGKIIRARTANQKALIEACNQNDLVFAVGPAGTGKTYTAVAIAVRALKHKSVKKIILARPAVEAGESLGFLPGDMKEKIDPYVKPLYEALLDMIPTDKYQKYLENGTIEIVPLAFMRGRTLDNCFVILDEAQNATETQLKMFLTRMGPNAKVIVNGDLSQIDLPRNHHSGLQNSLRILEQIKGIKVVRLTTSDVVRHRLVKEIIKAYDRKPEK